MFSKQQHSLVALAVLFALVVVGLAAYGVVQERARVLASTQSQAQAGALFSAAYSGRTYEGAAALLDDALGYIGRERPSREALRRYLAERTDRTSTDEYVIVTDAEGRLLLSSEHPSPEAASFADRPWFRANVAGRDEVVGSVLRSRVSEDVVWTVSRRLEDSQGRFTGAIAVGARAFGVAPTAARPPSSPQATVWTRDGRLMAATYVDFDPQGGAIAPELPPIDLAATAPGVSVTDSSIIAYAPVPGWPLMSVVTYDKAGVLAPWRRELATSLVVVLAALLGGGVLVWLGARSARREEQARAELTRSARETEAALAQRDLLLKEVHHRVKNSLMMTSSLLGLQARSFEDPRVRAAFDQTRARLSSISLVHEALYAGDGADVDLSLYLKRLLHEIAHAHGADQRRIALTVDIDPMALPAERATLVGLIVSEVVSNAFKHAFPDLAGHIRVEGICSAMGAAEICVADDGVGYRAPAGPDDVHGLGTKLIRVLAEQLGGRISFANVRGTTFRLSFGAHADRVDKTAAAPAGQPVS